MERRRDHRVRVVVTGGAGFIGTNLVRGLCAADVADPVVVLDDFSTGRRSNLADVNGVRVIEGTILDVQALERAFAGAEAVVHLAARPSVPRSLADPLTTDEINVRGTLLVLEMARRVGSPHVIVASSSSVYGANPVLPKHEGLVPRPRSPYAVSKLAGESYALAYGPCFELPVLAMRFFNVYGPFQPAGHAYAAVIPAFVSAALQGRALPLHGDGTQTRDFTYVDTVVEVIVDALRRRVTAAGPVNLAFGSRVSLLEMIAVLESILSRGLAVDRQPARRGDVHDSQADDSLLRSLFPTVEPVGIGDGLRATVEWHRHAGSPAGGEKPEF